jgi:hypothetical protein
MELQMLFDVNFFKTFFNGFLKPATYQSELEAYLESKNPQTPGDVDHWLAEFDNERRNRSRFLADNGY